MSTVTNITSICPALVSAAPLKGHLGHLLISVVTSSVSQNRPSMEAVHLSFN